MGWDSPMNLLIILLLAVGLVFFLGGAVGIMRFPDFYSRLHPAGKLDTLGSLMMLSALALANLGHYSLGEILTSLKIMLIVVFIFLANPTATHGIVDAGMRAGMEHWTRPESRENKP